MFTPSPLTPQRLPITHPLIKEAYLKSDIHSDGRRDQILVIQAASQNEVEEHSFDTYLANLLNDLQDLQQQFEDQIGHFDRVDICTH